MPVVATINPGSTGTTKKKTILDAKHPAYLKNIAAWEKNRLCYEGGRPFIQAKMKRYSKRESPKDFELRKEMAAAPGDTKAALNVIRNALAQKLPEVKREGDAAYLNEIVPNVDGRGTDMDTFIATRVAPPLLYHGKTYVYIDAPATEPAASRADERAIAPYGYQVSAEAVPNWADDDRQRLTSILIVCLEDKLNEWGLVDGQAKVYKHFRLREDEQGTRVELTKYDEEGKPIGTDALPIERIPVVCFELPYSLAEDIADIEIQLLNLDSSDFSFLWKANFPILTQQKGVGATMRQPGANRVKEGSNQSIDTGFPGDDAEQGAAAGVNHGLYYTGDKAPDFAAPPVDNVRASMEKQAAMSAKIRWVANIALTSLSVHALEQSGKSKEADRVGEEAGLAFIATALETGERAMAEIFTLFLGSKTKSDVNYPKGYSIKTPEERRAEATELRVLSGAVQELEFRRSMQHRIADLLCKGQETPEALAKIHANIDKLAFILDDDKERAVAIQADVTSALASKETASVARGWPAGEGTKATEEKTLEASLLAPFENPQPPNGDLEDDGTEKKTPPAGGATPPVPPGKAPPVPPTVKAE